MIRIFFFLIFCLKLGAQGELFIYEVDLTKSNDAFNVTLSVPPLSPTDNVYSFVAYAPGVHQPLNFGRFVKMFKVYDKFGDELVTNKISINDFRILDPTKVSKIIYEIDDTFDMSPDHHPIDPHVGTGITEQYSILNTHGVFGYFKTLKNRPIKLKLNFEDERKIGTSLNKDDQGFYETESYYQLTDSPILMGSDLSYASTMVDEIQVEAYVYSPSGKITAEIVLDQASDILQSAKRFIGYSPVNRYTFLMYFASSKDIDSIAVFQRWGALEHSLSSTYAMPDKPKHLPLLKDIMAHEFMHILSPLHLHSDKLANFDYSTPSTEDQHVWLYEGATEWASYIMQVKSGMVSPQDYLDYLSEKINNSKKYRADYSLTRISKEWSTEDGQEQYGNIYQFGALTAAMLDIELLRLSNGTKGLREVYLELIKLYGKENPFDNSTFFDTLVEMTYPEIEDFIENHIRNNSPFDFKKQMKHLGIKYHKKRLHPDNRPTLGYIARLDNNNQLKVISITPDYLGKQIKVGDIISKINGSEVNRSNSEDLLDGLTNLRPGKKYSIDVIRDNANVGFTEVLYPKYERNVFEFEKNPSAEALRIRNKAISSISK